MPSQTTDSPVAETSADPSPRTIRIHNEPRFVRRRITIAAIALVAILVPVLFLTTGAPEPKAAPPVPDAVETLAASLANDRTTTFAVVGDSTGDNVGEWVYMIAVWIGTTYDKSVTIQTWDSVAGYYHPAQSMTEGKSGSVMIFNGSAPGRDMQYSTEYLAALLPSSREIGSVFVSHAHNQAPKDIKGPLTVLANAIAELHPESKLGVVLQNPDNLPDVLQRERVESMRAWAERRGIPTIDVLDAFLATGDFSPLLADRLHPNEAGYEVWASVFEAALIDAAPRPADQ